MMTAAGVFHRIILPFVFPGVAPASTRLYNVFGYGGVVMNAQRKEVSQPGLPRGFVGWLVAWMMPLAHSSIYNSVAKILNLRPEDSLLEVACGGGRFLKKYASHVQSIAGLDLSTVQITIAKRRLRGRIAAGTAQIVQGDASRLPWDDGSFSVVTTMGSFIGFPKPLESLKEMFRVLRPGGKAVVSIEYNAEDGKDHSKEIEKHGMWLWTEDEVRALMKETGFAEISINYDSGFGVPKMLLAIGVKR
jgi:SAM-dependent methyltransferase